MIDDRVAAREVNERIVGGPQSRLGLELSHVASNRALANPADHGRDAAGFQIGARQRAWPGSC